MIKVNWLLINILFPIWLFWILPTFAWLIILPVNFVVDSLVLYLAMRWQHMEDKVKILKQSILKIWIVGFVSDLLGAGLILILTMQIHSTGFAWDIFHFPGTTLISIPGVILAGLLIFYLNKHCSFTKCGFTEIQIRKLSLALAIGTAPYAMFIPLYG